MDIWQVKFLNAMYNSKKKHEILRGEFNKICTENYKLLLRQMEGDIRKCKHIIDIDKKTEYYE